MLGSLPTLLHDLQLNSSTLMSASASEQLPRASSLSSNLIISERDSDRASSSVRTSDTDADGFGSGNSNTSPPKSPELSQEGSAFKGDADQSDVAALAEAVGRTELSDGGSQDGLHSSGFRFDVPPSLRVNPMVDPLFHARMITRVSAPTFSWQAPEERQRAPERQPAEPRQLPAHMSNPHDHDHSAHHDDDDLEEDCDCNGDIAYLTSGNNKKRKSARHGMSPGDSDLDDRDPWSHGNSPAAAKSAAKSAYPELQTAEDDVGRKQGSPRRPQSGRRETCAARLRQRSRQWAKCKYQAMRAMRMKDEADEEERREREEREREEAAAAAAAAAARKKRTSKAESKARAMGKSSGGKKVTLAEIKARMRGQQQKEKDGDDADAAAERAPVAFVGPATPVKPVRAGPVPSSVSPPALRQFDFACITASTERLLSMRKEIDTLQSALSDSLRPIDDAVAAATDALARIDAGDPNAAASAAAALAAARAALPEPYMRSITGPQGHWNTGLNNSSAARLAKLLPQAESSASAIQARLGSGEQRKAETAPRPALQPPSRILEEAVSPPQASTAASPPRYASPPPKSATPTIAAPVATIAPPADSPPLAPVPVSAPTMESHSPSGAVTPTETPDREPSPSSTANGHAPPKLSRRKKANMNNVHHKSNYIPSRTPLDPKRTPNATAAANGGVPAGCLDHPTTGNALFPDEWVCLFCDYELLYGEPPLMLRAIKNRKKMAHTRKRAQDRAHRAAMGIPPPVPSTSAHKHSCCDCDSDGGCEASAAATRCECGNPLCYEEERQRQQQQQQQQLAS